MKISIVIVTCNSSSIISGCLDSCLAQEHDDLEIIVVDNGSTDRTPELLNDRYPTVTIIENSGNAGAAQARNQAIDRASGEWIMTLDPDAALEGDFLAAFVRFLKEAQKEDRIGMVIPKILYPDGNTIYSLGHNLTLLRRFYDVGRDRPDNGSFPAARDVFGACSATALYLRAMLLELKKYDGFYFDPDFFFMAEDVDLAWRLRKKGWNARPCLSCISTHAGNSMGLGPSQKNFFSIRNRFLMMFKNDPPGRLILFSIPLFLYEVLRYLSLSLRGEGGVYLKAVRSALELIRKNKEEI